MGRPPPEGAKVAYALPGQNPGTEPRQKLLILRGLSSSIRDCSKGMIVDSPAPPFTCGGLSDRRERRRRQVKRLAEGRYLYSAWTTSTSASRTMLTGCSARRLAQIQ